jgi:hypothetical protein
MAPRCRAADVIQRLKLARRACHSGGDHRQSGAITAASGHILAPSTDPQRFAPRVQLATMAWRADRDPA